MGMPAFLVEYLVFTVDVQLTLDAPYLSFVPSYKIRESYCDFNIPVFKSKHCNPLALSRFQNFMCQNKIENNCFLLIK